LLGSPERLRQVRESGYQYTRGFTWPRVGAQYLDLGQSLIGRVRDRRRAGPLRASSLPELRLDHLLRMTDDTGIIQHATFSVPARSSGYCVDDNARALMVAVQADRVSTSPETKRLINTYLAFLHAAQTSDGRFQNFMTYARAFSSEPASEDCSGRALWALGLTTHLARDEGHRMLARQMFERGLPFAKEMGLRGSALAMLGLASFLTAHPEVGPAASLLGSLSRRLCDLYRREASADWRWFEPTLTYDNALMPLALFRSYPTTKDAGTLDVAKQALGFLEETSFRDGRLSLVGNAGWHKRHGTRPESDEQPLDAAAFVLGFRGAYQVTGDHRYLTRMRESFAWFLGSNRLSVSVYDSATAGCRDGLGASAPNLNQGAESTICFLLSLLEMLELAGEGLEYPEPAVGERG
jgi:hypothetical protein